MNSATTDNNAISSSLTKLAPETIRIRNAIIEKFSDEPIEELNNFLQRTLEVETDELKRLGLLAARVHILRQKVLNLKAFIRDETMAAPRAVDLRRSQYEFIENNHDKIEEFHDEVSEITGWQSLQMIEPGEINGVRFFKGTVINAKDEDADRLISSGKAIVIDDEGNPVEQKAEQTLTNTDSNPDTSQNQQTVADDNTDLLSSNDKSSGSEPSPNEIALSDSKVEESSKEFVPNEENVDEEPTATEKKLSEIEVEESFKQLTSISDDGDTLATTAVISEEPNTPEEK